MIRDIVSDEIVEHLRRLLLKSTHNSLHFAVTELERLEEVVLQFDALNVAVGINFHEVSVENRVAETEHSSGELVENCGINVLVVCCVAVRKSLEAEFAVEGVAQNQRKEFGVGDVLDLSNDDAPKQVNSY